MSSSFDSVYARPVAESGVTERLGFLRRVYGWMTVALAITAGGAALSIQSGLALKILQAGNFGIILFSIGWMGIGWLAQKVRHTPILNMVAFTGYALYTGAIVSSIVYIAMLMGRALEGSSMTYVYQALFLTVLVFGGLTVYTFFTKRDFSFLSGFLFIASIALVGLSLMNMFIFHGTTFSLIVSFLGVMIFSGYILFDTQKILKAYPANEHLAGAITLFTDFVLLFMHILRIILILASSSRR